MPSSDLKFYEDFFVWTEETARKIMSRITSGKSSFAQLNRFVADCSGITKALVEVWDGVPRGGKFFKLVPKLAQWVLANPDPLLEVRVRMRTMQKKWDSELTQP
jgi:hypothetical protein